ncbi:MAG TPA: ABC transporter permease [Egibacteraceae bacterium]|jgi:peptide/nickel transport system permease protein|nr:ABC transporter permease [Egibacteraceae bacterium]
MAAREARAPATGGPEQPPAVAEELTGLATRKPADGPRRSRAGGSRLLAYLGTVYVLVTLTFVLPRAMPGDPLVALLDPAAPSYVQSEALREQLAAYYGLDRPLGEQYVSYLAGLARGDLGTSIRHNRPVAGLLAERLPWTLLLVAAAMTVAVTAGLVAGATSGWRRGRGVDRGLLTTAMAANSLPAFFLASLAVFVFAATLGWFPLSGGTTPFAALGLLERAADIAHHLVLPAAVMAVSFAASQYLVMRAGMVSQLGADFLLMGRAKGLRERRLKYGYAARNALLPVVSLIAVHLGFAITNSIYVEVVFAYPGLGRLMFEAVEFRDYPVLQACFLVLGAVVVTANYLADVLSTRLDPRMRG